MKLNELSTGKKIYVLTHLDPDDSNVDGIELIGAFSTYAAAEKAMMEMWIDWVKEEDIELATDLQNLVKKNDVKGFEKLAKEVEGNFPAWDDLYEFYGILETRYK